ncbi:hypothetical protein [Coleofasciculus sp. FACHB-SPT9]|uniref:hypothetical protein n=1 Tax=Cyanophyceae TaxID=3028117 RepID=UPI001686FD7C|nr:hypothetical protein [Coleofasciculus sp. FACHB-SPT9]MBD1889358.1 hypothetical protein [Coleofasciculus sp. FACHB-SPT9]
MLKFPRTRSPAILDRILAWIHICASWECVGEAHRKYRLSATHTIGQPNKYL